jgi:hypothetical protein
MGGGSEMTNTAGCIPFGDHRGCVNTNPSKSIADVLRKEVLAEGRS